MKEYQNDII